MTLPGGGDFLAGCFLELAAATHGSVDEVDDDAGEVGHGDAM